MKALLFLIAMLAPFAIADVSPNPGGGAGASLSNPVTIGQGGTGQTTAANAFNALSCMTTGGDLIYGGASGVCTRLANGSAGKVLTSAGTTLAPTWETPSAGGSSSGVTGSVQLSDGAGGFTAEGSLLFWDASANELGIGTNAPTRDLTISSAGEPTIMFTSSAAAANAKHWQYTVSGTSWYVQALNDLLQGDTGMVLNRTNGTATTVGWSQSYVSCVALTTNGSAVMGCTASDERLKKDIVPFERGLEAIAGLTPKSFKFKDPGDLGIEHTAFIAQNVAKSIPEAVRIAPDGYMQVDYWTIIATQANAINELRVRLEALEGPKAKALKKKAIPMKPVFQLKPKPMDELMKKQRAMKAKK